MSRFRMSIAAVASAVAIMSIAPAASAHDAHDITVKDAWVKTADSGMSAVFGTIKNRSGKAITVVSATTPASAMTQLHEVVMKNGAMVMQEKKAGFRVPARGKVVLKPGGNHIMLMQLTGPVTAGKLIPVTIRLSDGSTVTFKAVGKPFAAGNETYQPSASGSPMPMSMG